MKKNASSSLPLHLSLPQVLKRLGVTATNFNSSNQDTAHLIGRVSDELGIGKKSLSLWRETVAKHNLKLQSSPSSTSSQIGQFIADCVHESNLGVTMSPFVKPIAQPRKDLGFGLVARATVPAGAFLVSVPTRSIIRDLGGDEDDEHDETKSTGISGFLAGVDRLSVKLLAALTTEDNKFHSYAHFLRHCGVAPPRNLPFLVVPSSSSSSGTGANNDATFTMPESELGAALHSAFEEHVAMLSSGSSSSPLAGVPEHYLRWAASMVLSRRVGGTMMVPVVDLINHSPRRCNSFYTMCDESSITGLDLVDNILAGVPTSRVTEPHLHVFALAKIPKGAEVTMSYSDVDPAWKLRQKKQREDDEDDKSNSANAFIMDSGSDIWNLTYGFLPPIKTDSPLRALQQVAEIVTRTRLARRAELFPRDEQSVPLVSTKGDDDQFE